MDIVGYDTFGVTNNLSIGSNFYSFKSEDIPCGRDYTSQYVDTMVAQYLSGDKKINLFGNMSSKGEWAKKAQLEPFLIDMISDSIVSPYSQISHIIPLFGETKQVAYSKALTFVDYIKYYELDYNGKYPDYINIVCPENLTSEQLGKIERDGVDELGWPSQMGGWSEIYNPTPNYTHVCFVILVNDVNVPECEHCRKNFTLIKDSNGNKCECQEPYKIITTKGKLKGHCGMESDQECEWYESIFGCGWYPTLWNALRNIFK